MQLREQFKKTSNSYFANTVFLKIKNKNKTQ